MSVKIITDTSADLNREDIEKYGIEVLSFRSIFGDEVYNSGVDLTNDEFFEKLANSPSLPTTSQTPPQEMYDIFKKAAESFDEVIYFCISSKGSGQYNTACMLREQLLEEKPDAKLFIVDTRAYSVYIGKASIYAAQLAAQGLGAEEIIEKAKELIRCWHCLLLVDDLTYLQKGGRIKKSTAVLGTMLDIKPVLMVQDGMIEAEDKLRGSKKIVSKLVSKIEENGDADTDAPEFLVVHSDEERAAELCEKLEEIYGSGTVSMICRFGPIIGTHVGSGAFAVVYKTKEPFISLDD